jgi:hypothetical protein
MEWAGTQDICVVGYDGAVDPDNYLFTLDGVTPGDVVTANGLGGSPKDQQWEIFAAGDCGGTPVGVSQFHISCSDGVMNGVEDCGKRQGDGKSNDPGLINDWLLEGMEGDEVLECTGTVIPDSGASEDCGLGIELVAVLPGLAWLYRRRRSA